MRICDLHWGELRQAIDARGLSAFVANDQAEAEARVRNVIASKVGADRESFEPLLGAMFSIANNALHQFGMSAAIVGERCPLCSLATWWIERASREQLDTARRLGLVPPITQRGGAIAPPAPVEGSFELVPESVPPSIKPASSRPAPMSSPPMSRPAPFTPPRPGPPSSRPIPPLPDPPSKPRSTR